MSSRFRLKSGVLVVENVELVDADAIGESDDCVEVAVGVVNSISNIAFLWKREILAMCASQRNDVRGQCSLYRIITSRNCK